MTLKTGDSNRVKTPLGSQLNPPPPPVSTTFPAMSDPWRTTPSGWVAMRFPPTWKLGGGGGPDSSPPSSSRPPTRVAPPLRWRLAVTLTARIRNLPKSADGVQALGRPPPREASSLRPHRRSVPVVRRPERRRSPTPSAAEPRHRSLSGDRQGKRDENDRDAFHASGIMPRLRLIHSCARGTFTDAGAGDADEPRPRSDTIPCPRRYGRPLVSGPVAGGVAAL